MATNERAGMKAIHGSFAARAQVTLAAWKKP
jgi:hypothetical protein